MRVFVLPGYGADISTFLSLEELLFLLARVQTADHATDPRVAYLRDLFRHILPNIEIVALDLPGVGTGTPLTDAFDNGVQWAKYISDIVKEVDSQRPAVNIAITRSASGSIALVAKTLGAPLAAVSMTSATFPNEQVRTANVADIKRAEAKQEYTPNWLSFNRYFSAVLHPQFLQRFVYRSTLRASGSESDGRPGHANSTACSGTLETTVRCVKSFD